MIASRRARAAAHSSRISTRAEDLFWKSLLPLVGIALVVRVLVDDRSAPDSRHTGSFSLSVAVACLVVGLAIVAVALRRRHLVAFAVLALWCCLWTAIAVGTNGASTETIREGVRELSVIALAAIVFQAPEEFSVEAAGRLVQLAALVPALIALHQWATGGGLDIAGDIRANGTFAHPNSAAMFFGIAATASLWLFLSRGRRPLDALAALLFAAAVVATFSIDGVATLALMAVVLALARGSTAMERVGICGFALLVVAVFAVTPLGFSRLSGEADSHLTSAEVAEAGSSFDTRLYRWRTLLPEWERAPVFGQGLGTTTTAEGTTANRLNYLLPHNEYIRYTVETGVIGMLILAFGLFLLVRALVRGRAAESRSGGRANGSVLGLAIVAGCLVNSLADNTLLNSPTCYAAALILAAVLASPALAAARSPRLAATAAS